MTKKQKNEDANDELNRLLKSGSDESKPESESESASDDVKDGKEADVKEDDVKKDNGKKADDKKADDKKNDAKKDDGKKDNDKNADSKKDDVKKDDVKKNNAKKDDGKKDKKSASTSKTARATKKSEQRDAIASALESGDSFESLDLDSAVPEEKKPKSAPKRKRRPKAVVDAKSDGEEREVLKTLGGIASQVASFAQGKKPVKKSSKASSEKTDKDPVQTKDKETSKSKDSAQAKESCKAEDSAQAKESCKSKEAAQSEEICKAKDSDQPKETCKAKETDQTKDTTKAKEPASAEALIDSRAIPDDFWTANDTEEDLKFFKDVNNSFGSQETEESPQQTDSTKVDDASSLVFAETGDGISPEEALENFLSVGATEGSTSSEFPESDASAFLFGSSIEESSDDDMQGEDAKNYFAALNESAHKGDDFVATVEGSGWSEPQDDEVPSSDKARTPAERAKDFFSDDEDDSFWKFDESLDIGWGASAQEPDVTTAEELSRGKDGADDPRAEQASDAPMTIDQVDLDDPDDLADFFEIPSSHEDLGFTRPSKRKKESSRGKRREDRESDSSPDASTSYEESSARDLDRSSGRDQRRRDGDAGDDSRGGRGSRRGSRRDGDSSDDSRSGRPWRVSPNLFKARDANFWVGPRRDSRRDSRSDSDSVNDSRGGRGSRRGSRRDSDSDDDSRGGRGSRRGSRRDSDSDDDSRGGRPWRVSPNHSKARDANVWRGPRRDDDKTSAPDRSGGKRRARKVDVQSWGEAVGYVVKFNLDRRSNRGGRNR
jgi:hypothetical protein